MKQWNRNYINVPFLGGMLNSKTQSKLLKKLKLNFGKVAHIKNDGPRSHDFSQQNQLNRPQWTKCSPQTVRLEWKQVPTLPTCWTREEVGHQWYQPLEQIMSIHVMAHMAIFQVCHVIASLPWTHSWSCQFGIAAIFWPISIFCESSGSHNSEQEEMWAHVMW
jgi:hypothetical protein